jgi:hypothetical protein
MKTNVFLLLVLFGTIHVTTPASCNNPIDGINGEFEKFNKEQLLFNKECRLIQGGMIVWFGIACVDQLLACIQRYCTDKVDKVKRLQEECENQEILAELHNRAFNFKLLNGLLCIPRVITLPATWTFPVLTLLMIESERRKDKTLE